MKKYPILFITLFLFAINTLYGLNHPREGRWGLEAEYLYFMPSTNDVAFVIDSVTADPPPAGKRIVNNFSFHSGFRVGGAYSFCECERTIHGYYARLCAEEKKVVEGSLLWATRGYPDFIFGSEGYPGLAESDLKIFYQRAEALIDQAMFYCCGLQLYVVGGAEYADISFDQDYVYLNTSGINEGLQSVIAQKSTNWGIGPQFGFAFDYEVCQFSSCCSGNLSLTGSMIGGLLANKMDQSIANSLSTVSNSLDLSDESSWRIVSNYHMRIGLQYDSCFSCCAASLGIGYEFTSYINALTEIFLFNDALEGASTIEYYDFDIQGLYVSFALTF